MLKKIFAAALLLLVVFLVVVATKNGHFRYERSGLIQAQPSAIYPYISNLKLAKQWSPYEKMDPEMKETFSGTEATVGSSEDFESKKAGSGRLEITELVPNERVAMNLNMTAPFKADNKVTYTLAPEGEKTKFTWVMEGESGFLGKLMSTLINCEKMIGDQFEEGIANLKKLVEKP